jgi:hypothetical protein
MTAPASPTATFRHAAALLKLWTIGDYEGFATLLSELAPDPVATGAVMAALTQVTGRLAQDAGVDLSTWLDDLIRQIAAAEAA